MPARGSQSRSAPKKKPAPPTRGGGPAGTGAPRKSIGIPGTGAARPAAPSRTAGATRYTSGARQYQGAAKAYARKLVAGTATVGTARKFHNRVTGIAPAPKSNLVARPPTPATPGMARKRKRPASGKARSY